MKDRQGIAAESGDFSLELSGHGAVNCLFHCEPARALMGATRQAFERTMMDCHGKVTE